MEATINNNRFNSDGKIKKQHKFISVPLLIQSIKANWVLWLILTIGNAAILGIINLVMGSQNALHSINMDAVMQYVNDEEMEWLQILGLFQTMGFSLSKLQVMSSMDVESVFNDMIYSIATVLLPLIYVIIVSNKLVASQIDNGSMAYVLSTPTNRKTVIRTQYIFLVLSIIAMSMAVTCVAIGTEFIGYGIARAKPLRTFLLNFGSMTAMLAFSGITFACSCIFSRSKNSLALGGGFCVFCFIAEILGLFGSDLFVSVGFGVVGMKTFNYLTLLTLYNCPSISTFAKGVLTPNAALSFDWIWQCSILIGISLVGYFVGSIVFNRKDLPL